MDRPLPPDVPVIEAALAVRRGDAAAWDGQTARAALELDRLLRAPFVRTG